MSGIFTDPLPFGGLVNASIKANRNTFLNLGQGSSPAPGTPPENLPALAFTSSSSTYINATFDVSPVTGTAPITYTVMYGTTITGLIYTASVTLASGTIYDVVAQPLDPATTYEFQLTATNAYGATAGLLYPFSTEPSAPSPPSGPPTVPILQAVTNTTLEVQTSIAGIEGTQPLTFTFEYGLTTALGTISNPTGGIGGNLLMLELTGLPPSTTYFFACRVTNSQGTLMSAVSEGFSTLPDPPIPTPPSGPPTVPIVSGTPTSSSITVTFDVAGITGDPTPTYSIVYGTLAGAPTPGVATFVSGTTYEATVTGLLAGTDYYFNSVASNAVGSASSIQSAPISTASAPLPPSALQNLAVLTFLVIDGSGIWSINTSGNPSFGSMMLTGVNAGTWQGTDGKAYLNGIRAKPNTELILSLGGSGLNALLPIAFPSNQGAIDLCDTIWNVLFGAGSPNTLNWSNLAWAGLPTPLFFSGIDLDMEGVIGTGILAAFMTQWENNVQVYTASIGTKTLTMAPQSPNTWMTASPSTSIFTDNFTAVPFASSTSALSTVSVPFLSSAALICPGFLKFFNYVFIQVYNQSSDVYPGGVNFNAQMAQWAYLIMISNRVHNKTTKLIFGFGTTDASPLWNAGVDGPLLATAIPLITALVNAQLLVDVLPVCTNTEWCGGWGAWNSPSNISVSSAVYANGSVLTPGLMGSTTMLYANASGIDTTWAAGLPIINLR